MKRLLLPILCTLTCVLGFSAASVLSAWDENGGRVSRAREDFELMRLFAEAYEQIEGRYVTEVDRRSLIDNAVKGMLNGLDPYSTWIPPGDLDRFEQYLGQEFVGIGIQVQLQDGVPEVLTSLPDSPAWKAGVRVGDLLERVDETPLQGLSTAEIGELIRGPIGQAIRLTARHENAEGTYVVTVTREKIQLATVTGVRLTEAGTWDWLLSSESKLAYVRLTHFSRQTPDEFRKAMQALNAESLQGLVIDLRSNPGGLIDAAVDIADMLLDEGRIVSMNGRAVDERTWDAHAGVELAAEVPIAVLMDRQSASASEILAAALQDHARGVIAGERSFGKGSVQNVIRMENGRSALKLTTAHYLRPKGTNIHRFPDYGPDDIWGVLPDEALRLQLEDDQWKELRLSRDGHRGIAASEDIAAVLSRDPQLNKVFTWLQEQSQ